MADKQYPWASVKAGDDPNDPSKTGQYKDVVDQMTPEQKSPLINFPQAPEKAPFKINGGT